MKREEEQLWIGRVLAGDVEAFGPLVERYSRPIFALVVGIVRQREEAEELVQEIFLRAYTKLPSYGGRSAFSTWLYRIACNMALSAVRPKRRFRLLFCEARAERLPEFREEPSEDAAFSEEREQALLAALESLTPEERALVQLHYYEERPLSACAEIFKISESNCKVRLFRIRKKLKQWIEEKT